MRLTELDPRWFDARYFDGAEWRVGRSGFTMLCPHCRQTRLAVTTRKLKMSDQLDAMMQAHPGNGGDIVPGGYVWNVSGEDFATISITPSIDATASGHWHGFITNGEVT